MITGLNSIPVVQAERLLLEAFSDADIPALAAILAEPEVTRNITANGSTPERCRDSAAARIAWHNRSWSQGYGVWAVKCRDNAIAPAGELLGWCGFAAPDVGEDPEILYGLAPQFWGQGLAKEMVSAAMDWLFDHTACNGISAVIFGRLNPASVALAEKFGMTRRGVMPAADFMPDHTLARDVLDYEVWRLANGVSRDPEAVLFEAPYKGGLIASLEPESLQQAETAFVDAARSRPDFADADAVELQRKVSVAFRQGVAEPFVDWLHISRDRWRADRPRN